jgi:hypothetical protein
LQARGARVIVYEADKRFQENPGRFQEFYDAVTAHGTPLLIATLGRWLAEERAAEAASGVRVEESSTAERLLAAIHRALDRVAVTA